MILCRNKENIAIFVLEHAKSILSMATDLPSQVIVNIMWEVIRHDKKTSPK